MSYDKSKLASHFQAALANTTDDPGKCDISSCMILGGAGTRIEVTSETGQELSGHMPDQGPPTLYISQDGVVAINAFISECMKDREIAARIGEKAVENRLKDVIKIHFGKSEEGLSLAEFVKTEVLQQLRQNIRDWTVRVPIANLKLSAFLQVGNVTFEDLNDGIVSNAALVMNWNPTETGREIVSNKAHLLKLLTDLAAPASAWAVTKVRAHSDMVREVTREQVALAINAIRAFTHVFYSYDLRATFGTPDELIIGMTTGVVATIENGSFTIPLERCGWLAPFDLNEAMLKRLQEEFHFDTLGRIAGAEWDTLNTLERAVRVSFLWLGRSIIARTHAESLTYCTIAIERLLIVDKENATTEKFADRLTYLLSDDPNERMALHKTAKRLYDIRSLIVHAGFTNVELQQLALIENMAIGALRKTAALLDTLKTHEALTNLLHERKMQ